MMPTPARPPVGWASAVVVLIVLAALVTSALVTPALAAPGDARAAAAESAVDVAADGDDPDRLCRLTPGVIGDVCDGVGSVVGDGFGAIVGSGADAVIEGMVGFVVDGAGWLLDRLITFIDDSTTPDLQSAWFRAAYRDMAVIGMLGVLPFLLLALVQALVRQDAGLMLRSAFGFVPLAAIGTAGAVVVVDLLVRLTDQLSAWVGRGLGSDLSSFATDVGTALAGVSGAEGGAVAGLAALIGGAIVAFAAFVIWLELLLRQAAIYVAVLFFPLAFMAMVWPATAHWLRRLAQGLVAIVLSKFVIVSVMALAANALGADGAGRADEGFSVVVSGGALLSLAALAPYVLLRLIPVFDAGLSTQLEGTFRRPTAAVATPVRGGQMTGMIRQRVGGHGAGGAGGAVPGASGDTTGAAATSGATGAAGGLVVAAGAAGARRVASTARSQADQIGTVTASANGSSPPASSPTSPSGSHLPATNGQASGEGARQGAEE